MGPRDGYSTAPLWTIVPHFTKLALSFGLGEFLGARQPFGAYRRGRTDVGPELKVWMARHCLVAVGGGADHERVGLARAVESLG